MLVMVKVLYKFVTKKFALNYVQYDLKLINICKILLNNKHCKLCKTSQNHIIQ